MHCACQFFACLADHAGSDVDHVVDALAVGMALAIPNVRILAYVRELTAEGLIEPVPRPRFAELPVRLMPDGRTCVPCCGRCERDGAPSRPI